MIIPDISICIQTYASKWIQFNWIESQTKTPVQSIHCTQMHCKAYVTLTMLLRVLCKLTVGHYLTLDVKLKLCDWSNGCMCGGAAGLQPLVWLEATFFFLQIDVGVAVFKHTQFCYDSSNITRCDYRWEIRWRKPQHHSNTSTLMKISTNVLSKRVCGAFYTVIYESCFSVRRQEFQCFFDFFWRGGGG